MNEETKKKMTGVAHDIATDAQKVAEKKAKAATGWKKVAWILAAIGAAVVGYFTGGASQQQPDVSEPPAVEVSERRGYGTKVPCSERMGDEGYV